MFARLGSLLRRLANWIRNRFSRPRPEPPRPVDGERITDRPADPRRIIFTPRDRPAAPAPPPPSPTKVAPPAHVKPPVPRVWVAPATRDQAEQGLFHFLLSVAAGRPQVDRPLLVESPALTELSARPAVELTEALRRCLDR